MGQSKPQSGHPTELDKIVDFLEEGHSLARQEAKARLKQLMLDIIGKDETPNPEWELSVEEYGYNRLRAELRRKVESL